MENLTFKWIWNSFQTEGYDEMLLQIPGREPARGYYESQFSAAPQVAQCCAIFLCYLGGQLTTPQATLLPHTICHFFSSEDNRDNVDFPLVTFAILCYMNVFVQICPFADRKKSL